MAAYLVGDIQGCFHELKALLKQVEFNLSEDTLYVAGDIVARGPDSLATLRFIKSLGRSAKIVLGNHDLHLLSVHAGIKKPKKSDQLSALLAADDCDELMNWLASQLLIQSIPNSEGSLDKANALYQESYAYMTHAGVSPQWTLSEVISQASFVHSKLSSQDRNTWLAIMYGEEPNNWFEAKTEIEKFRYSVNALTRMRFCFLDGSLEFDYKESPKEITSKDVTPWFELSKVINQTPWVFGHWASLMGNCSHENIYPLDTGCVWGNHLTMLRWHDKKLFTQGAM